MSTEAWVLLGTTIAGFLISIATNQITQAKTRGEWRSLFRNFPLHRHVNGKIIYPAEYEPNDIQSSKSND